MGNFLAERIAHSNVQGGSIMISSDTPSSSAWLDFRKGSEMLSPSEKKIAVLIVFPALPQSLTSVSINAYRMNEAEHQTCHAECLDFAGKPMRSHGR